MEKKSKAEYRSSIRSKELIESAFFEVLQKKPSGKITVTDIVQAAKINRGTFYAHYRDINELIRKIEDGFISELENAVSKLDVLNKSSGIYETLLEISAFLEKNEERYRELLKIGKTDSFVLRLQERFNEIMEEDPRISEELRFSPRFKVRSRFFASGVANAYISYFKGELDVSLTELAKILGEIITNNSLLF